MYLYTHFSVDGKIYDLSHFNSQIIDIKIDDDIYKVSLEFGCHCFTDEKENGPFYHTEGNRNRYWSQKRYDDSLLLPNIIKKALLKHSTYVIPFKKNNKTEQYHYLEDGYFAIFFYVNSIDVIQKTMKIYIVSAYDKTTYNGNLPKGKPCRLSWVLSKRVKGEFVLS